MKQIVISIIIITLLAFSNFSNAQVVDYNEEIHDLYTPDVYKQMQKFVQKFNSSDYRTKSELDTIYIKVHFIRQDDGTGQFGDITDIENDLSYVNSFFANVGVFFTVCDEINYINSDLFYYFDNDTENDLLFEEAYQTRCINMYFMDSLYSSGRSVGGLGYGMGYFHDAVMIDYDILGNNITMAHELGHVFHLYHTHGRWSFPDSECSTGLWDDPYISNEVWCKGFVNDQGDINSDGIDDCLQTGDDVCDTPAEPNLYIDSLTDGCTYIGMVTDEYGSYYTPDVGNIMSYGPCKDHLTEGQYAKMRFTLENYGLHLLGTECGAHQDTLIVTNTYNVGLGSLRWAMFVANNQTKKTVINFDIPGDGPHIIYIESYLPIMERPFTINGISQPSGEVIIDGSLMVEENMWGFLFETDSVIINGVTIQNIDGTAVYNYYENEEVTFQNLKIRDCSNCGIYIKGSSSTDILNCEIYNTTSVGIYADHSQNSKLYGNSVYSTTNSGMYFAACSNFEIGGPEAEQANEFYDNSHFGIYLNDTCSDFSILNNYLGTNASLEPDLGNNYYGLCIYDSHDIQIGDNETQNFSYNNGSYGMFMSNSYNLVFENNEVYNNNVTGIYIDDSHDIQFGSENSGNLVSGSTYHGIHVINDSYNVSVLNNIVGLDTTLSTVSGNGYFGIVVDSCDAVEIGRPGNGNIVVGSGYYGIEVDLYSEDVIIQGNAIGTDFTGNPDFANLSTGIKLNQSTNIIVGGNTEEEQNIIAYNPYSMRVQEETSNWQIKQNSFYCSDNGIYIDETCSQLDVPTIDSVTNSTTVFGTGTDGTTVWIYTSDATCAECEGKVLVGKQVVSGTTWQANLTSPVFNEDKLTVLASNSLASSDFSACFTVTDLLQGMDEMDSDNPIKIYPNPANDKLYIETKSSDNAILTIQDMNGRTVLQKVINKSFNEVRIQNLEQGIYCITVQTDKETITKKFVKL
jgi:parallel beta-helix repeat protein